ncbi:MAG: SDR family oxidoreductase [Ignavibacteria bacterium]|nr:SDR family oxidoreductase [Ignavibacteria bacterium]
MKTKQSVALVTGGGRRLGRQIALALAKNGYDVAINYHVSRKEAELTVRSIHAIGRDSIAIKADISKKSQVHRLVEETLSRFGRIDLLINNSAIFIKSPWNKTTEHIWDTTIDINLKGTFLCSQIVAPQMLKQKRGRIINIASLGGIQPWSFHLPYSISKAGVIMLTRIMAKSLAPHILVNAIAPGTIILSGEENRSVKHIRTEKILLQRYGKPSDIIDTVLFLARTADYITGQVIAVDGGSSIQ